MMTERRITDEMIEAEKAEEREKLIALYRSEMRRTCADLAGIGSNDHRTKNEKILEVIARLLYLAALEKTGQDRDELPF